MGYGTWVTVRACVWASCMYTVLSNIKYIFINFKIYVSVGNDVNSGVWFGYSFQLYGTAVRPFYFNKK